MKYIQRTYKYWITFLLLTFATFAQVAHAVDYEIKSVDDWNYVADQLAGRKTLFYNYDYKLKADLDFSEKQFKPWGGYYKVGGKLDENICIKGSFDGEFHTISGINSIDVSTGTSLNIGLFAVVKGATIKNLIVKDVHWDAKSGAITTAKNIGFICGYSPSGEGDLLIENCAVINCTAENAKGNPFGGIVGTFTAGAIKNCVVENVTLGNADGEGKMRGGIVGNVGGSCSILNCYASATFPKVNAQTGGIVGACTVSSSSSVNLQNCYSTGSMTTNGGAKTNDIGGIIGQAQNATIKNCGTSVAITITASSYYPPSLIGGAVGVVNTANCKMEHIYAVGDIKFRDDWKDNAISGINSFYGSFGANVSVGPDISTCYNVEENHQYLDEGGYLVNIQGQILGAHAPLLPAATVKSGCMADQLNRDLGHTAKEEIVWIHNKDLFGGYPVPFGNNADMLGLMVKAEVITQDQYDKFFSSLPQCGEVQTTFHIKKAADIDELSAKLLAEDASWSADKTFIVDNDILEPVTSMLGSDAKPFLGVFKGGGFTINMVLTGATNNAGLISVAGNGAKINNVHTKGNVSGGANVGAVVGKALAGSTIIGCANGAVVSGTNYVGGVVGLCAGTVSSCLNVATITGTQYVGGIAGSAGSMTDCGNMGYIKCAAVATSAGIAGVANGTLTSCFNGGYTNGAAIANGGTLTDCHFDAALSANGQTGASAIRFTSTSTVPLTGWTGIPGAYPVPAILAESAIGHSAASAVYFVGDDMANAMSDSVVASPTTWVCDNSSVLRFNQQAYLPIAAGNAILKYTSGGYVREVPVTVNAAGKFAGGFGNTLSPFIITNVAHLNEMAVYVTEHNGAPNKIFELANDITDGVFENEVIGRKNNNGFCGVFRSSGVNIYNIPVHFDDSSNYPIGLVGYNKGTIERISVTGSISCSSRSIAGSASVGGIVGFNEGRVISCVNAANITSKGTSNAGGIVGNNGGFISKCVNIGKVKSDAGAAGIASMLSGTSSASVSDCFNGGFVSGTNAAGIVYIQTGETNHKPDFTNNVNVAKVVAVSVADALYINGGATPSAVGAWFDSQHASCNSAMSGAVAGSSEKITQASITNWTTSIGLYPQVLATQAATLASAPVFLNEHDNAGDVKHDFTVAAPAGVKWSSVTGCLKVDGTKVSRVRVGDDTLKASLGSFERLVPVTVSCVWTFVEDEVEEHCNMYGGKEYDTPTLLTVVDTTDNSDDADCGTIHTRKIQINIGQAGKPVLVEGCGSVTYNGMEYTESTVFTNADCDIINIKVYPAPTSVDSVVNLLCKDSVYTYTASNGTKYSIKRSNKPIVDSLVAVDHIKSKVCDCDSILRKVKVSIPTYVNEVVVTEVQCNTYTFTNIKGEEVVLGFPIETRDENEEYLHAGVQNIEYRDTNFTSGKDFDMIKVLKVGIFKPVYTVDRGHLGRKCSKETYVKADGTRLVFEGERYLTDTVFYDYGFTNSDDVCPSIVGKVFVRLKGITEIKDTIVIGSHDGTRCTDCAMPVVLTSVTGNELADKGFCDKVEYKMYESDVKSVTALRDVTVPITIGASATTCGVTTPYKISINKSVFVDSLVLACDSVVYTKHNNKVLKIKETKTFNDTLSGAVPGCGCDSIWKVTVKIFKPTTKKEDIVACDSYVFRYQDASKPSIKLVGDTVIVDTLLSSLHCDSIIRTSTVTIHKSYGVDVTTPISVQACNEYVYTSPVKGDTLITSTVSFQDTLLSVHGCDSIISVSVFIDKPVVIDSVVHACSRFIYVKKSNGNKVVVNLGDDPDEVTETEIEDTWPNANENLCDTVLKLKVYSHTPRVMKPTVASICGYYEYTRFDGTRVPVEKSMTILDTLKSNMCDCDSIVRRDSFSVGKPYYAGTNSKIDTTLYGCYLNGPLVYKRHINDWNDAREIEFKAIVAEVANKPGFLNEVKRLNPAVVALDTVSSISETTGLREFHYYWMAYDTMNTIAGCDSIVPFRVEFDYKHFLGRKNFYVDHKNAPFTFNGITYQLPVSGVRVNDSVEVVLPSTTGGCDSTFYATVRMYSCAKKDFKVSACDSAVVLDLHNRRRVFKENIVISDTLRYLIPESDTAKCDSVIATWTIKVGRNTPSSEIEPIYIGGCDFVTFAPGKKNTSVFGADTTFRKSTTFSCHYVNNTGCDSLVKVYAKVHNTETTEVYYTRTDYYRYVSPRDGSIMRITSDTVITENVPGSVVVTMENGQEFVCDSNLITHIKIRPAEWRDTVIVGCDSVLAMVSVDSIRGSVDDMRQVWYKKNTKFDLPNSVTSDVYYHVSIVVNKSVEQSFNYKGCGSVTYKDEVYEKSTDIIERYITATGCDSIDTVHIVVFPVEYREKTLTGCGYLSFNGKLYRDDEEFTEVVKYKNGCDCDSLVTTTYIKIFKPEVQELVIDSCMYLTYPKMLPNEFNAYVNDDVLKPSKVDSVYTESVSFYQYGEADENGCATIINTQLNVNNCYPYPVIINKYNWILALNTDLLYKDVNHGRITGFQWFKGNELILGANESYYTEDKLLEGCYHVHVMYGDYEVESGDICIDPDKSVALAYDLYPDPVAVGNKVSIKCNFEMEGVQTEVYNSLGVKVYAGVIDVRKDEVKEIPYSLRSAGHFYLKLVTTEGAVLGKKFIVK